MSVLPGRVHAAAVGVLKLSPTYGYNRWVRKNVLLSFESCSQELQSTTACCTANASYCLRKEPHDQSRCNPCFRGFAAEMLAGGKLCPAAVFHLAFHRPMFQHATQVVVTARQGSPTATVGAFAGFDRPDVWQCSPEHEASAFGGDL